MQKNTSLLFGVTLILLGVLALAGNLLLRTVGGGILLGFRAWPIFVVGAGLLFCLPPFIIYQSARFERVVHSWHPHPDHGSLALPRQRNRLLVHLVVPVAAGSDQRWTWVCPDGNLPEGALADHPGLHYRLTGLVLQFCAATGLVEFLGGALDG